MNRAHYYFILDEDGEPQAVEDLYEWARWFEDPDRLPLARNEIEGIQISTDFLGINHRFAGIGPPILWETMIFDPRHSDLDLRNWRYSSKADALAGHEQVLELVKKLLAVRTFDDRRG